MSVISVSYIILIYNYALGRNRITSNIYKLAIGSSNKNSMLASL